MIDKQDMRTKFSARLHEALDDAAIRKHGRGTDILEKLKRSRVSKTPQAISKWLNGGAIPEADSMEILAYWLQVRREWLEYGVLPKRSVFEKSHGNTSQLSLLELRQSLGKVPIISWAQAALWRSKMAELDIENPDEWIACPVAISKFGYALKVEGDSMTNLGMGRTYPPESIIFVDPEVPIEDGDRVIAKLPNASQATFKVLTSDMEKRFLKPINPQYPTIEIGKDTELCGKIVGLFVAE